MVLRIEGNVSRERREKLWKVVLRIEGNVSRGRRERLWEVVLRMERKAFQE